MKRFINKKSIIIASVALLLLISVGTTLAFVLTDTEPVENTFTPSKVSCAVVENGKDSVSGSIVETGNEKKNVKIKNTGNTDAYIRVAVVINWANADGTRVWATKPVEGTDFNITYLLNDGWFQSTTDGYYYYKSPVAPDDVTTTLISSVTVVDGKAPIGTDNTQYYLSVEIVASAIQSTPASTVHEQWGVTVAGDGTISK